MKKVLMASSAIVGAAALAASPAAAQELTLNAFQVFVASGGEADAENARADGGSDRGFGFSTNTEVHVKGEIMADNGITFGFRVEFEADSGETNNVDENSIYAQGSFGKLEFGNNDGAEDTFMVNGSNSGVDYGGVGNPTSNFLDNAFAGQARTSVDFANGVDSSDGTKITYTTPNFNGFSAGISYAPDSNDGGDGNTFNQSDAVGIHDHIGVGLGFDGEFNGVGVELGLVGAFGTADAEPEDDVYGIGGGFAISYAGFTFAAGGIYDDADGNGGEGYAFDAGIGYSAGPWRFSGNFIYSEDDDSDDELIAGSANVGYTVAPGVRVFLTGYIGEEDFGTAQDGEDDSQILAVTSGIAVSF